jgi:hypothetical protein
MWLAPKAIDKLLSITAVTIYSSGIDGHKIVTRIGWLHLHQQGMTEPIARRQKFHNFSRSCR